jgi:hypothetical protein
MDTAPHPDELRALWAEDRGAARDVYIEDTSADDWQAVRDCLLAHWPCSYTEDSEPAPLPSAKEILRRRSDLATHLSVRLSDHLSVHVHFFEDWQVELSFNPGNVSDNADVDRVLDLVLHVGRTLRRTVHMAVESRYGERPPDDLYYDPTLDRIVRPPEP